ncbi:hypothetical protein GQ53DRAFT_244852 [Thozetella sp. PMI_491]|nr:hypothetical protein GQ53DRAFT_244852 [Thozetella sp. PMI_491]
MVAWRAIRRATIDTDNTGVTIRREWHGSESESPRRHCFLASGASFASTTFAAQNQNAASSRSAGLGCAGQLEWPARSIKHCARKGGRGQATDTLARQLHKQHKGALMTNAPLGWYLPSLCRPIVCMKILYPGCQLVKPGNPGSLGKVGCEAWRSGS